LRVTDRVRERRGGAVMVRRWVYYVGKKNPGLFERRPTH